MDPFFLVPLAGGVVVFLADLASNRFLSQNRLLNALVTGLAFGVVAFLAFIVLGRGGAPLTSEGLQVLALLAGLGALLVFIIALIVNAISTRNEVVNALATAVVSAALFAPLMFFFVLYLIDS